MRQTNSIEVEISQAELKKLSKGAGIVVRLADGSRVTFTAERTTASREYRCVCGAVFDSSHAINGHLNIKRRFKKSEKHGIVQSK